MAIEPRYITDLECSKTGVELEVMECVCGFHLGVDFTYLEQVGKVDINCPVCQTVLSFDAVEEEVS